MTPSGLHTLRQGPTAQDAAPAGERPSTQEVGADDVNLAEVYERQQSWPELAEHLLAQAEDATVPEERAQHLARAATVFEAHLADPEGAWIALQEAVRLSASHERLVQLERLAHVHQQAHLLPGLLQAASESAPDADAAAAAFTALARHHRASGAWAEAAATARKALACDPADRLALRELEEAERRLERWGDLTETLRHRLERDTEALTEGDARAQGGQAAAWEELAALYEERLNDPQHALWACQQSLQLAPERDSAWARMERLCQAAGRPDLRVAALESRYRQAADAAVRTRLAVELAHALQVQGDPERALQVLEDARSRDPEAPVVHEELAQLYSARGSWEEFVGTCWKHAAIASEPKERARLAFEAGRVLQNRLNRPDAAQAAYNEALTHEPHHLNARRGLVSIHRSRGALDPLAEGLWELAELTDDRDEKLAGWFEAAALLRGLGDVARAEQVEARLLAHDPAHPGLWGRRVDQAAERQDWRAVQRLCDEAAAVGCPGARLAARRGQARLRLGDPHAALVCFGQAQSAGEPGIDWRVDWLRALVSTGRPDAAAALARRFLTTGNLPPEALCAFSVELGRAYLLSGEPEAARSALASAVAAVPHHKAAFLGMAEAHRLQGQIFEALPWLWSAFDHAEAEAEKVAHALTMARWLCEEAQDAGAAETVLEHALDHLPAAHALLDALRGVHLQTRAWPKLLSTLKRQAALRQNAERAALLQQAALLSEEKLRDDQGAAKLLAAAVDAHPNDVTLVDRLEALLWRQANHEGLERHLRKQLARLGNQVAEASRAVRLWEQLAALYQGPLANPELAAVAHKALFRLNPGAATREALAVVQEARGRRGLKAAVPLRLEALAQAQEAADMIQPLRALARNFGRLGDLGRSLNATAAVVTLGQGTPQERALVAQQGRVPYVVPAETLSPAAWLRQLQHPDADPGLGLVFAHAAAALAAEHARPPRTFDLPPSWPRESDRRMDAQPQVARLRQLASVLGVKLPPVTMSPRFAGFADLVVVDVRRKAYWGLVLGRGFFEPHGERTFAFLVSRLVARLRPEYAVTWPHVAPSLDELENVLAAAQRLGGASPDLPPERARRMRRYEEHLRHATPADALQALTATAAALRPRATLTSWLRGVAFTLNRAALLACGDLSTALAHAEPDLMAGVAVSALESTRELILWALSDGYTALRRELAGHG